jgi:hypothetical protein
MEKSIELKCSACGETSPLDFDLCWNCGNSLPGAEHVEVESEADGDEVATYDSSRNPIEVYRAKNGIEAQIVAGALESAGIKTHVEGDSMGGMGGSLGWEAEPRVMVAEADAEVAREIIAEYEQGESMEDDENELDASS